ncbi:MAG: hypothetical protein A2139_02950 [Desulfobacca sp. RBG_16_60_12]|nr:MAG: hypothetical protein A2139_02950 [Desulfobacca sp. RBG_16_60_12]
MSRTLLVKFVDEEKKITIPDGCKVTFGPSIPNRGRQEGSRYGPPIMEYALRVYEGATEKTGLLAVFTGVRSFHEVGVTVEYDVTAGKTVKRRQRELEPEDAMAERPFQVFDGFEPTLPRAPGRAPMPPMGGPPQLDPEAAPPLTQEALLQGLEAMERVGMDRLAPPQPPQPRRPRRARLDGRGDGL